MSTIDATHSWPGSRLTCHRGERAANTLEADLAKFERKLDEILSSMGADPTAVEGGEEQDKRNKSS